MWIKLSDELIYFGQGGITRINSVDTYMTDGKKSPYITALYSGITKITVVKESIDEIEKLLYNK